MWYSKFLNGCQSGSACPWRVGTCQWRVDGDRRLSYWLDLLGAIRKIERRLNCVNVRSAFSQWERRWNPSSTWNYVSTRKQQNTLQLTTIKKTELLRFWVWNFCRPTVNMTIDGYLFNVSFMITPNRMGVQSIPGGFSSTVSKRLALKSWNFLTYYFMGHYIIYYVTMATLLLNRGQINLLEMK